MPEDEIRTEIRHGLDDLTAQGVEVSFFDCPTCGREVMAPALPGSIVCDLECDAPLHAYSTERPRATLLQ